MIKLLNYRNDGYILVDPSQVAAVTTSAGEKHTILHMKAGNRIWSSDSFCCVGKKLSF